MKKLNGYYYCFSHSSYEHGLCSIAEVSREMAKRAAINLGARLYIVKYRNGIQQGKKRESLSHKNKMLHKNNRYIERQHQK